MKTTKSLDTFNNLKQPTAKRKQSGLVFVSIALTLVAFVILMLASFVEPFMTYSNSLLLLGLGILAVSWTLYFFGGRSSKSHEPAKESVITVIGCKNCDMREERAFAVGDYIPKDMGPCKKCSGPSYIKAIYSVETKKE